MDIFFNNTHPETGMSGGQAKMQPFASLLVINRLASLAAFCNLPKSENAAFCSLSFSLRKLECRKSSR